LTSSYFPWYYKKDSTPKADRIKDHVDISFFSHVFLDRAEYNGYPVSYSSKVQEVVDVFREIMVHNCIHPITLLRLNANLVYPYPTVVNTLPHFDHHFKHKNIIIYLTGAGGNTIVEGEVHEPQEDDVIIFEGEHYHQTPVSVRRVVLVATFIDEEML